MDIKVEAGHRYYINHKKALLQRLDKTLKSLKDNLIIKYNEEWSETIIRETRLEYEDLIPLLPYVGGKKCSMMTYKITYTARYLAFYKVMKRHGKPIYETGKIIYETVEKDCNKFPKKIWLRLNGRLMFTKQNIRYLKRISAELHKREYPQNSVMTVIEGDGKEFDFGVDYTECSTHKFYHTQGADELTPFICLTDFPLSKAVGSGLSRTKTLAECGEKCDFRFKRGMTVTQGWPPDFLKGERGRSL